MTELLWRTMALPMARGFCEKGRNLTKEESKALVSEARAADDVIKKKSKKAGKGKKGRR